MQIIVALLVPLAFALVYVLGGLTGMLYIFVVCAHIRMSPREVAADRGPSPGVAQEGVSMDLSNTSNSGTTRALGLTVSCSLLLHQDHPLTKAGCSHCPSSLALELLSCSHWGAHPPPLLSNISQKTSARAENAELYTKPRGVCPCPRMPEPPRSMVSHVWLEAPTAGGVSMVTHFQVSGRVPALSTGLLSFGWLQVLAGTRS